MTKTYTNTTFNLGGLVVRQINVQASTDPRFLSQKQLFALGTPAALAELQARAAIIHARKEAA